MKNSPALFSTGDYKMFSLERFEGKNAVLDFWRNFRKHILVTSYRAIKHFTSDGGNERYELSRIGLSLNRYHWIQDLMCHISFDDTCQVVSWELIYDPTFLLIASKNNDNVAMPQSASVEPSIITKSEGGITKERTLALTNKFISFVNGSQTSEAMEKTIFDTTCIVTFPGDVRTSSMIDICGAFRGTKSLNKFHESYFSRFKVSERTVNWRVIDSDQDFALLHSVESGRFDGRQFSQLDHYILIQTDEIAVDAGAPQSRITAANHILNPVILSGDIRFQSATKGVSLIIQIVLTCLVVLLSVAVVLLTLYIVMKHAELRLEKQRKYGANVSSRPRPSRNADFAEEMQPLRLSSDNEEEDDAGDNEYTNASRVARELETHAWIEPREEDSGNDNQV
eukprot:CAMPEP_0117449466 /NCGR_PEP_ID=MMETSP0759-20121206/7960_1 /TAXON_ID=63605 /ORGANISM="Percolomonas cosmopolitus, Strain WS" /LENGTH=395 /DNA_ID=CAMNT_0005241943 /DNA_START=312 /DNA_END=1499 /DNA_ORIENTATION=+